VPRSFAEEKEEADEQGTTDQAGLSGSLEKGVVGGRPFSASTLAS
jgi:hypothetical protein